MDRSSWEFLFQCEFLFQWDQLFIHQNHAQPIHFCWWRQFYCYISCWLIKVKHRIMTHWIWQRSQIIYCDALDNRVNADLHSIVGVHLAFNAVVFLFPCLLSFFICIICIVFFSFQPLSMNKRWSCSFCVSICVCVCVCIMITWPNQVPSK